MRTHLIKHACGIHLQKSELKLVTYRLYRSVLNELCLTTFSTISTMMLTYQRSKTNVPHKTLPSKSSQNVFFITFKHHCLHI
jgi:hypothetical protein